VISNSAIFKGVTRQDLALSTAATSNLDIVMERPPLEEQVTVVGADARHRHPRGRRSASTFPTKMIMRLPTARDPWS